MNLFIGQAEPGSLAGRLLGALQVRGHAFLRLSERAGDDEVGRGLAESLKAGRESGRPPVAVLCPASGQEHALARTWFIQATKCAPWFDWLVVTRLGTHPDARHAELREAWRLEEAVRGWGGRTLTLRLGPMLGPESPLWLRLRSPADLPRGGAKLLNPVAESDVVGTLEGALSRRVEWSGWYEVAGPEVWSLAELAALAREAAPALPVGSGAWEPPLDELEEHRLADAGPWLEHFGMSVRPLAERAREWARSAMGSAA